MITPSRPGYSCRRGSGSPRRSTSCRSSAGERAGNSVGAVRGAHCPHIRGRAPEHAVQVVVGGRIRRGDDAPGRAVPVDGEGLLDPARGRVLPHRPHVAGRSRPDSPEIVLAGARISGWSRKSRCSRSSEPLACGSTPKWRYSRSPPPRRWWARWRPHRSAVDCAEGSGSRTGSNWCRSSALRTSGSCSRRE